MSRSEEDIERIVRELHQAPDSRVSWLALAGWCRCHPRPPPGLSRERFLPVLFGLLQRDPGDRRLVPALLGLLEAELPEPVPSPAPFWPAGDRARKARDHHYDTLYSLPLEIRRRADGARMRLVPGSTVAPMRGVREPPVPAPPDRPLFVAHCYLDVEPVTVASFRRLVEAPAGRGPKGEAEEPARVPWRAAQAYADTVGYRLPSEVEWGRPLTREELERSRPGRLPWRDQLAPEALRELEQTWNRRWAESLKLESAHGIEYPRGDRAPREWTASRGQDLLELLPEDERGGPESGWRHAHLARGLTTLEPASDPATRHAFRLAVTVGPPLDGWRRIPRGD